MEVSAPRPLPAVTGKRQVTEAEWEMAMKWSRSEYEADWMEHMLEKERVADLDLYQLPSNSKFLRSNIMLVAVCMWLEELGPAFGLTHGTNLFLWYEGVTSEQVAEILLRTNAPKVQSTLKEAQKKLEVLMELVDFSTFKVVESDYAKIPGDPQCINRLWYLKNNWRLWKELARSEFDASSIVQHLKEWQVAWDGACGNLNDKWCTESRKRVREDLCSDLEWACNVIKKTAEDLADSPEFQEKWHEHEAIAFCRGMPGEPVTSLPRKKMKLDDLRAREEKRALAAYKLAGAWDMQALMAYRTRFFDAARCYSYALAGMVSTDKEKPTLDTFAHLQTEIDVSSKTLQKAASKLQSKLQEEHVQKEVESRILAGREESSPGIRRSERG